VTHLLDIHADLRRHRLLSDALVYWRSNIRQRRPYCPACRKNYADDATPGAILFGVPAVGATVASVTMFCSECWATLPIEDIECVAERVLQPIIPGGRLAAMRR
jgi:hypothetical protein